MSSTLRRSLRWSIPPGIAALGLVALAAGRGDAAGVAVTDLPAPPGPIVGMLQVGSAETAGGAVSWNAGLLLGDQAVVPPRSPLWDDECAALVDERHRTSNVFVTAPARRAVVTSDAPVELRADGGGAGLRIAPRTTNDGTIWAAIFKEQAGALYEVPGLIEEQWRRPLPAPGTFDVELGGSYPLSAPGAVVLHERPGSMSVEAATTPGRPLGVAWAAGARGARVVVSIAPRGGSGRGLQCLAPDTGRFTVPGRWTARLDPGPADVIVARQSWSYVPDAGGWIEVVSTASTSRRTEVGRPAGPPEEAGEAGDVAAAGGRASTSVGVAVKSSTGSSDPGPSDRSGGGEDVDLGPVTSFLEEVVDRSEDEPDEPAIRRVRLGFGVEPTPFLARGSPSECLLFGDESPLRGVLRDDDLAWAGLGTELGLVALGEGLLAPLPDDRAPRYEGTLPADGARLGLHVPDAGYDLKPVARPGAAEDVEVGDLIVGEPLRVAFDRPADGASEAVVLVAFDDRFRPYSVACPADRPVPAEWTQAVASPWAEVWVLRWTHTTRAGPDGTGRVAVTTAQRTRRAIDVR